jgi:DtxR family Mn-dependent transcriptional regulator
MPDETSGLSRSVEDYLKAIYSLGESGKAASTSAIAEALEVQPASVTGMVKRLADSGYLEHVPYRGVKLTDEGTHEALRIVRRHRILETYLTGRLGFRWEDVHQEAERLEHAASDELIERMAAALKNPSHDPHGAPIPTSSGEVELTDSYTLAELAPGEEAQVRAVRDDDSEGLRAVETAGLLPGTRVRVIGRTISPPVLHVEVDVSSHPDEKEEASAAREGTEPEALEVALAIARRVYVVPTPMGGERQEQ